MDIKFSVIIPAYNAEKYILKALNSVKDQTYKNIEVVIVNDGSKDKTDLLIQEFINNNKDIDIKYICIENNGLANARNIGIGIATGDYFCNLDSDDYLDKNTFKKINDISEEFDVCYYGYKDIADNTNQILTLYNDTFHYTSGQITGIEAAVLKLKRYIWICQGNAVYNLKMIKGNNIYNVKGINQGEDFYFIIRALLHAKNVVCIPENYFNCINREDSMMHSKFDQTHSQVLLAISNLINDVKEYTFLGERKEEVLNLIRAEYLNAQAGIAKKVFKEFSVVKYKQAKSVYVSNRYKQLFNYNQVKDYYSNAKKIELFIFTHSLFIYFCFIKLYYFRKDHF